MMPPSRCCTVRLLPSGLTTPGAIAAPASGAVAAHQPRPPKNRPTTSTPARIGPRSSGIRGAPRGAMTGAGRGASAPLRTVPIAFRIGSSMWSSRLLMRSPP